MKLTGWSKEIPVQLEQAIKSGKVTVTYNKKDNFDYLKGSYVNEHGIIIEFQ